MARISRSFSDRAATGWVGTGARVLSVRATDGAMICFSIRVELQNGQVTKPRLRCVSYASLDGNQLSKGWAWSQAKAYLIMAVQMGLQHLSAKRASRRY